MTLLCKLLLTAALSLTELVTCIEQQQQQQQQPMQNPEAYTSSLIHDILVRNEIIGDVLDDFEPKMSLSISYPDAHGNVLLGNDIPVASVQDRPVIEFHEFVGPHRSASRRRGYPNRLSNSKKASSSIMATLPPPENLTYTLALTDPDAKSREDPIWSEMCHWIVTNMTLLPTTTTTTPISTPDDNHHKQRRTSTSTSILSPPDELLAYLPPSPPPQTGKHRYIFVLLAGSQEASAALVPPKDSKEGRQHWGYDGEERTGVKKWAGEFGLEVVGVNFFVALNEEQ